MGLEAPSSPVFVYVFWDIKETWVRGIGWFLNVGLGGYGNFRILCSLFCFGNGNVFGCFIGSRCDLGVFWGVFRGVSELIRMLHYV